MKIVIEVEIEGLGGKLKAARESAGLNLKNAGKLSGMSDANFSRIENEDVKGVPMETLIRAANAVNLDLAEAMGSWVLQVPGVHLAD